MSIPTVTSASGLTLPAIGFGTYKLRGIDGVASIDRAVDIGYRLLDSAVNYENEGTVGAAVRETHVARDELIVTSKLPGRAHARDKALDTIAESLFRLGLDRIDLYLIHWPNPGEGLYVEAWRGLIEARERGLVAHIGVCNFLPEHLDRLENETGIVPEVNQIELHPYFPQTEALAYHRAHGILTESWSPLGRGSDLLQNEEITAVAEVHDASPAQIVLAWHLALGTVPIPKATSPERQRENLASVGITLTSEEVTRITELGHADGRLWGGDPATHEEM